MYNEILVSSKKKQTIDICQIMDEPKNGMLSEKKPDTQTLYYVVLFTWNVQKSKSRDTESR